MHRVVASIAACLALLVAACGGGDKNTDTPPDPIRNVPNEAGIRDKVKQAQTTDETEFPASKGKTLQQLADGMTAGPSLAMASSIFTTGPASRMAFGMIGQDGRRSTARPRSTWRPRPTTPPWARSSRPPTCC